MPFFRNDFEEFYALIYFALQYPQNIKNYAKNDNHSHTPSRSVG